MGFWKYSVIVHSNGLIVFHFYKVVRGNFVLALCASMIKTFLLLFAAQRLTLFYLAFHFIVEAFISSIE